MAVERVDICGSGRESETCCCATSDKDENGKSDSDKGLIHKEYGEEPRERSQMEEGSIRQQ